MEKLNSFISNLSRAFTSCSIRGENVERQGRRVAQGLQNQVRNNNAQQAIEMAQRANDAQGRALLNPIMGAAQQAQQPAANDNAQPAQQAQQPAANDNAQPAQQAQQPAANDNAQQAQQPVENANAQQQAQQPVENANAQQAQQPAANDNAQQAQQPAANANAQQAQQPAANDNAQQAQQPAANANAQQAQQPAANDNAQQAQQPVANDNAQPAQQAQQPAANDNAQQQAQQPAANDNAQQAQQPAANDNAQQARAAQQNNPNPIFTVRHTIGSAGYNLENAPAMNRTFYEGTHIFTGYGPNYNQSIEMDTEQNNEDKFIFKNIPELKISKGEQVHTFAHERIVRVKRSGSIDQNDGQFHMDRNNNVRTNGQIH